MFKNVPSAVGGGGSNLIFFLNFAIVTKTKFTNDKCNYCNRNVSEYEYDNKGS